MKRSALFRIILWSIVIAILTTAMVGIGFGISFNRRRPSTQEALAVTTPPEASIAPYAANAVVISNGLNIWKSPSLEAEVVGHFEKRDAITVERVESVNGWEWAYVTEPVTGWVMRKYLTLSDSENVQETVYPNLDVDLSDGKDTFPASSIRELEIEWAAGDILIQPHDTDQITVKEDGVTEDKYAMVLNWAGDTLKIHRQRWRTGSSPVTGTIKVPINSYFRLFMGTFHCSFFLSLFEIIRNTQEGNRRAVQIMPDKFQ